MWCSRSVRCISSRSRPSRRLSPEICSTRLSRWYKVVRCTRSSAAVRRTSPAQSRNVPRVGSKVDAARSASSLAAPPGNSASAHTWCGNWGQQGVRAQLRPAGRAAVVHGGQRDIGLPLGHGQLGQPLDRAARTDAPGARLAELAEQRANGSAQPFAVLAGATGDDYSGPPRPAGGQRTHPGLVPEKPFDVIEEGGWRLVRQAVIRRGVPDQQDGHLAVIVQQAPVDHLVPRHAPDGGVLAEQLLRQLMPPHAVPPAGEQPTVQHNADLRRGARGIGHLLLGEVPEPVGDPYETEQKPPAPDRHAQPLPQLQRRILRHITRPRQSGDLLVPYVLRPGPAVQQ